MQVIRDDGTRNGSPVLRVLVVDDEQMVRTAITTILSAADDLAVAAAVDGTGAVDALARNRIDVVLCDLRMPHVDGMADFRHITSSPHPRPAVAVLTTFADDQLVAGALVAGAAGSTWSRTPIPTTSRTSSDAAPAGPRCCRPR